MEGETNHASYIRIIDSEMTGNELHLFYRDKDHSPFVYHGRVYLVRHEHKTGSKPSKFVICKSMSGTIAEDALHVLDYLFTSF
jgi:hypothetical protein